MELSPLFESLSSDQVKILAKKNPYLLMSDRYISRAIDVGLLDFDLEIDQNDLSKYVKGDFVISRWKDKNGVERTSTFFDSVYQGESWELYERHSYDGDWESALDYHVNQEQEVRIKNIIDKYITDAGQNPEDFNDHTLQDLINEFSGDYELQNILTQSMSDCEADSYLKYVRDQLKSALEEYGEVKKFTYGEPIIVRIEMDRVIEGVFSDYSEDDEFLDILDRCRDGENNNEPNLRTLGECMFEEIFGYDYLDRPDINLDDRWYPDVDNDCFKEILDDRLSELE
jgi:hypothetical protein